jgi:hypothetical protein
VNKTSTHYQILEVSDDASETEIRAAWDALSRTYRGETAHANPEASRRMAIIDAAYAVLIDPIQRRQHDEWIALRNVGERAAKLRRMVYFRWTAFILLASLGAALSKDLTRLIRGPITPATSTVSTPLVQRSLNLPATSASDQVNVRNGGISSSSGSAQPAPNIRPSEQIETAQTENLSPGICQPNIWDLSHPANETLEEVRAREQARAAAAAGAGCWRKLDPQGRPWPRNSGYLAGFFAFNDDGLSTLKIDNALNSNSVYVKIYDLDANRPVRQVFIRDRGTVTLRNLSPGRYEMRYRNLLTGQLAASPEFELHEVPTAQGLEISRLTMTLHPVHVGDTSSRALKENEF